MAEVKVKDYEEKKDVRNVSAEEALKHHADRAFVMVTGQRATGEVVVTDDEGKEKTIGKLDVTCAADAEPDEIKERVEAEVKRMVADQGLAEAGKDSDVPVSFEEKELTEEEQAAKDKLEEDIKESEEALKEGGEEEDEEGDEETAEADEGEESAGGAEGVGGEKGNKAKARKSKKAKGKGRGGR